MLEEIKTKIQSRTNNSHKEVIMGVYRKMVLSHNSFCGCNYCEILKDYVRFKKFRHAIDKKMNSPDYDYFLSRVVTQDYMDRIKITDAIKKLKQEKDQLKHGIIQSNSN